MRMLKLREQPGYEGIDQVYSDGRYNSKLRRKEGVGAGASDCLKSGEVMGEMRGNSAKETGKWNLT